jgi:uncharacterized HAD superfamily protein
MHHGHLLKYCCVDIDGVLCLDPTDCQNDDGAAYEKFLEEAVPMLAPTRPIGALVTSRLEKYRGLTEKWLAKHVIIETQQGWFTQNPSNPGIQRPKW